MIDSQFDKLASSHSTSSFFTDAGWIGRTADDNVSAERINDLADNVHIANIGWWQDLVSGEFKQRNVGELLMLTVSELSEAMEADRKGFKDDHLPNRSGLEVELADAMIRILDIAGGLKLDIGNAFVEKMRYNAVRADHKREQRLADNGKKC